MATTDQDLREHLLATIEAAPELDPENRKELADVFLRELNARYTLTPRAGTPPQPARQQSWSRGPMLPFASPFWLLIPLLLVLSFALHFPIFLFVLIVFFAARAGRAWGGRSRRPMYW
jgi:hypothetical protein